MACVAGQMLLELDHLLVHCDGHGYAAPSLQGRLLSSAHLALLSSCLVQEDRLSMTAAQAEQARLRAEQEAAQVRCALRLELCCHVAGMHWRQIWAGGIRPAFLADSALP